VEMWKFTTQMLSRNGLSPLCRNNDFQFYNISLKETAIEVLDLH